MLFAKETTNPILFFQHTMFNLISSSNESFVHLGSNAHFNVLVKIELLVVCVHVPPICHPSQFYDNQGVHFIHVILRFIEYHPSRKGSKINKNNILNGLASIISLVLFLYVTLLITYKFHWSSCCFMFINYTCQLTPLIPCNQFLNSLMAYCLLK